MHEEVKLNCKVVSVESFLQPQLFPFHYFTEKHSPHTMMSFQLFYTVQQQLLEKNPKFLQAFLRPV